MLAINGVKTDLNNQENDFVRLVYRPTMAMLASLNLKRYTFGEVEYKKTINSEGVVEHSGGTNPQWIARCSFKNEHGNTYEYFVQYFESSFMDKDGNEKFTAGKNKTRWDFDGNPYPVSFETKPTLVWWLIFACGECELIPELQGWQNINRAPKSHYRLLNSAADASKMLKDRRSVARAEMLILNNEEFGGISDKEIKKVCRTMGIGGTDNMTTDECRNILHSKVIVKELRGNKLRMDLVIDFLGLFEVQPEKKKVETVVLNEDADIKALISALTEGSNAVMKHTQGKWMIGDEVIVKHKFSIDPIDALTFFFRENPLIKKEFEEKLKK